MTQVFVGILALCGVVVTALGGWIIAKHRLSGKIGTSDAAELWKEGKDLRDFLVARIDAQDDELRELKGEIRELKVEVAGLRLELRSQWKSQ